MTLWLVRCGRHGEGEDIALREGVVGIGWEQLKDLSSLRDARELRALMEGTYADAKPSTVANWAGQVEAFCFKIKVGDLVALPLKSSPAVAFGRVSGPYRYLPDGPSSMCHRRSVTWIREDIPRQDIDQDLRYSLGAFMTVCRIQRNNAEERIRALLEGRQVAISESADVLDDEDTAIDIAEVSRDQIRQRIADRFAGHDLARLIGTVLQAEGFTAEVSPPGPDGGVDILAGEGGMGFDGATLAVQVKSGAIVVDAGTLRELQGVMANFGAARGLLVSWGGFTKTARTEARRLLFQIRLWDSDDVIDRVTTTYQRLPQEIQTELPLQQIWTIAQEPT
jgi:restriction system protein